MGGGVVSKVKIRFIKDTKHEDVGIWNGKVLVGFVEIKGLVKFLEDENVDMQDAIKK